MAKLISMLSMWGRRTVQSAIVVGSQPLTTLLVSMVSQDLSLF